MAEALFQHMVAEEGLEERFEIRSVGTSAWHAGDRPHIGTRNILKAHNILIDPQKRAEQMDISEAQSYDYVIAMDAENVDDLTFSGVKSVRLLEFAPEGYPLDVPDPYYTDRFEEAYRLVEAGLQGLLEHIRKKEQV